MNCPKCHSKMVKAQATMFGESYDYCQTCKKEYAELVGAASLKRVFWDRKNDRPTDDRGRPISWEEIPGLPVGEMNKPLELSAYASNEEILEARKHTKGELIFVLDTDGAISGRFRSKA